MHDLDRTQFEDESYDLQETGVNGGGRPDEVQEMELAAELLELGSEAEVDRFLGGLLRRYGPAVGALLRSAPGQAVTGALKGAARRALPAGGLGGGLANTLGAQLASRAGSLFGLELEGLSAEDREFEAARQFVRVLTGADAAPVAAGCGCGGRPAVTAAPGEFGSGEFEDSAFEDGEFEESEFGSAAEAEAASPFGEAEEAELASELLGVNGEAELEQFLGGLLSRAGRAVGGFLRSDVGQALGGALKNVARQALPSVGAALGTFVAPGLGTAIGGRLGSAAANLFEVAPEAMERGDGEYEVARRFVRLSGAAAADAARRPRGANPRTVARAALRSAARRHARGLYRQYDRYARPARWYWPRPVPATYLAPTFQAPYPEDVPAGPGPGPDPSDAEPAGEYTPGPVGGRWTRRGNTIVIHGA
jgi:hypothetical protein